ncbi:MAG: DUF4912 domain-containing protein [Planctomycetaceae bacterium]|nr:DUF4912 domain-containing protein [Planctomycetaceae bacterium]
MKTSSNLNQSTVKELASLARKLNIAGWHEMRKTDLVNAILAKKRASTKSTTAKKGTPAPEKKSKKSPQTEKPKNSSQTAVKTADLPKPPLKTKSELPKKLDKMRGISGIYEDKTGASQDRFVLLVRDPYWLHVYWELCSRLIERAKAAMGHSWHTAVPILRLFRIVADGFNNPRRDLVRDIRIHSEVNNWYVDVQDPPGTFQVEIGFLSQEGNFFPVASSNIVQTPQSQVVAGTAQLDGHWGSVAEDFERIYKLSGGTEKRGAELKTVFEEQLRRSMSLPLISRFGTRSINYEKTKRNFDFTVNADVVIYGQTDPSVQVSIRGEPIRVANDGSFSIRYSLAEKRHVYPVEAKGSDGIETQQVILAIDRNTKTLETVFLENDDED